MPILFSDVTVVPMDGAPQVLEHAYVAVEGTKIASVGTEPPEGTFDRVVDGAGKVLLPGFVNAHTHLPMTLMRGYGGGCDLHTWLNEYIFPAEARLDSRAVAAGAELGLAEMIASGVTCVADMYMHTGTIAGADPGGGHQRQPVLRRGVLRCARGFLPRDLRRLPEPGGPDRGVAWGGGRARSWWTPRSTGSTPPIPLCGGGWPTTPQSTDWGCTSTSPRPSRSIRRSLERWGKTPIQALDGYGVWDCGAHWPPTASGPRQEDWASWRPKGDHRRPQPLSNLKLGSGVAPVPAMLRGRGQRGPGHRRGGLQQQPDLFEEIKLAAVLHKGVDRDPMAVTARQALEMATVNGARALGRDTGVHRPGKDGRPDSGGLLRPQPDPLPRPGGEPGLFRPRLRRGDEYGPGTRSYMRRGAFSPWTWSGSAGKWSTTPCPADLRVRTQSHKLRRIHYGPTRPSAPPSGSGTNRIPFSAAPPSWQWASWWSSSSACSIRSRWSTSSGSEGSADFNNAYNIYSVLLTISTAGLPVAVSKMVSRGQRPGPAATRCTRCSACLWQPF